MAEQHDSTKPFRTEQQKKYLKTKYTTKAYLSSIIINYQFRSELSEQEQEDMDRYCRTTLFHLIQQKFSLDDILKFISISAQSNFSPGLENYLKEHYYAVKPKK